MSDTTQESTSDTAGAGGLPIMRFSGNLADNWRKFKLRLRYYLEGKYAKTSLTNDRKVGILMTALGEQGIEIAETFPSVVGVDDRPTYDALLESFDKYFNPRKNTIYERFLFSQIAQQPAQRFDDFLLQLKTQAGPCEFDISERDNLIRDRLVAGVHDSKLRLELLRISDLSLHKASDLCRTYEASQIQSAAMSVSIPASLPLDAVKSVRPNSSNPRKLTDKPYNVPASSSKERLCYRCGNAYTREHQCPALHQKCNFCHIEGHFEKICRKKRRQNTHSLQTTDNLSVGESTSKNSSAGDHPPTLSTANLQVLNISPLASISSSATCPEEVLLEDDVPILNIFACTASRTTSAWYVNVKLNDTTIQFKVDTGAECNVLTLSTYSTIVPRPSLLPARAILKPYGVEQLIRPIGQFTLSDTTFFVVDTKSVTDNLLGFGTVKALGLVTDCTQEKTFVLNELKYSEACLPHNYTPYFQGLGKIPGLTKITLKPGSEPVIARQRRFAQSILPRIRKTLDQMEELKVITPVSEPTPWVSNMIAVEKHNNQRDIRICLDPKHLNDCIIIPKYYIPSTEEILSQLTNCCYFTVLDLSNGFWQLLLDEESSYLTTFQTPFGRYRYLRLCFGINSAPELFMKKIVEIFGNIRGCQPYFDDLIIFARTSREHDLILEQVMKRAAEYNVRFNMKKLQYKKPCVKFLGMIVSQAGVQIDPSRCEALMQMPAPHDKKGVLRFLGLIKYLNPFLKNVAGKTEHLRALTRSNTEFQWTEKHETEFRLLQEEITAAPVLRFFDDQLPITLQADSSQSGLGACLMQNGQPVAFASRALTPVERRYSQIEKETLAVVFGAEKFHCYIYGRSVLVQTDHKPLEKIFLKPIDQTTTRLQRFRIRLLKYDLEIKYTPGAHMYIADTLSRAYISTSLDSTPYEEFTVHANVTLTITPAKKQQFVDATSRDPVLSQIIGYTEQDWPAYEQIPTDIRPYHALVPSLTVEDGLLFYDQRLVVPQSLQSSMLELLHEGHLNVNKTKLLARRSLFWRGMSTQIEKYIENCQVCQIWQRNQQKEPLKLFPIPTSPWESISVDILNHGSTDYLVLYDYYSCWIEALSLRTKTTLEVIHHLKSVFSRLGIPQLVVSDNNPFNSREYKQFAADWGFTYTFTSPRNSQANGHAEKGVSIAQTLLRKNSDLHAALLQYRNAPVPHLGYSPSQLLHSRVLRTKIATSASILQPALPDHSQLMKARQREREVQEYYYNRQAKPLPSLASGDQIYFKNTLDDKKWIPGKIQEARDHRQYLVQGQNGGHYLRNRRFIRKPTRFTS